MNAPAPVSVSASVLLLPVWWGCGTWPASRVWGFGTLLGPEGSRHEGGVLLGLLRRTLQHCAGREGLVGVVFGC